MGKAKKVAIGIGIVIALFFIVAIAYGTSLVQQQEDIREQAASAALSPDQIKAAALVPSYDDLARYNEDYIGKTIQIEGKVLQIQNLYDDTYVMRVGTGGSFSYEDVVWVNYVGDRVLEDDRVRIWGKVKGLKEYSALLGNQVTIPEMDAILMDVIQKQGTT